MTATAFDVLAEATEAIQDGMDTNDAIERVLVGSIAVLGLSAAAVLVRVDGHLDLLASTSHRVADLELYQIQVHEGPCLEAIATLEEVRVTDPEVIADRWSATGRAIVDAGYTSVHTVPLMWRGRCYGALNAFGCEPDAAGTAPEAGRLLANAVSLVIAGSALRPGSIGEGLDDALEHRAVIERAKGALAEVRGIDVSDAFDALVDLARAEGIGVGSAAILVLQRALVGTLT